MENVAKLMNLKYLSHTTFYNIKGETLIPVILRAWNAEQQVVSVS